jgi:hypothetical protein
MERNHLDKLLKKDIQDNGDNADIQQDINREEDKIKEIERKRDELFEKMGTEEAWEEILEYANNLKKKHPHGDYLKYRAYHALICSTTDKKKSPYLDFPGEDSVEKFLDELLEKASQQQSSKQEGEK